MPHRIYRYGIFKDYNSKDLELAGCHTEFIVEEFLRIMAPGIWSQQDADKTDLRVGFCRLQGLYFKQSCQKAEYQPSC